uniref:Uncharacterized protein n=1 Tax=Rhizophora mucronata TaxID=61149 RepID=A0A2P2J307_RHIMU
MYQYQASDENGLKAFFKTCARKCTMDLTAGASNMPCLRCLVLLKYSAFLDIIFAF